MNKFKVVMKGEEAGCYHFECEADNIMHAIEQAENAYPKDFAIKAEIIYPKKECICQGFYRPNHCPVHGVHAK